MPGSINTEALIEELRKLYCEVDALYSGWSCPSSTECCRFGLLGRQPYVTSIELALVERAIARRGGLPSKKKKALAITNNASKERICPLLNQNNQCSIYEERPFGCRTFFCERAASSEHPTRPELLRMLARLRGLAERHKLGGDAARPLMRALEVE